jgi:hypothetical protein
MNLLPRKGELQHELSSKTQGTRRDSSNPSIFRLHKCFIGFLVSVSFILPGLGYLLLLLPWTLWG